MGATLVPVVPISNVAMDQFKSLRFIAVFASFLAIFSIACGSSQTAEEPSKSVKSTAVTTSSPASTEKREPTLILKPDATQEPKAVSKPLPTKPPAANRKPKPTNKPELIPTLTPSKAVEVERTPTLLPQPTSTPLPQPTPAPVSTEKVFDRSHHVATAADLVALANPDTKKALLNPAFLDVDKAGEQYSDSELVIGLSVNGQHKAYSTSFMSTWIVNDTVGGEPMLVTY